MADPIFQLGDLGGTIPAIDQTFGSFGADVVSLPTPPVGTGSGILGSLQNLASSIVGGVQTYYQAETAINQAKAQSQIAKAQGQNLVRTAQTGQPSSYVLLWGALGIGALLILTRK